MKHFYTYFHTRNDTGAVFYVGKGCGSRCHKSGRHNPHWKNVAAKHGRTVHLAMTNLTEAEAFEHEKLLILCCKDMGVPLVNCTDGGEGMSGHVHTLETRALMSAASKGKKKTPEHCASYSRVRMGVKRGPHSPEHLAAIIAANTGKTRTPETRAKLSAAKMGSKNGMTKLTDARAVEVFHAAGLQREIAARFGIDQSLVSLIKSGRHRSHATEGLTQ